MEFRTSARIKKKLFVQEEFSQAGFVKGKEVEFLDEIVAGNKAYKRHRAVGKIDEGQRIEGSAGEAEPGRICIVELPDVGVGSFAILQEDAKEIAFIEGVAFDYSGNFRQAAVAVLTLCRKEAYHFLAFNPKISPGEFFGVEIGTGTFGNSVEIIRRIYAEGQRDDSN